MNDATQSSSLNFQLRALRAIFRPNGDVQTAEPVTHIAEPSRYSCHLDALVEAGALIGEGTRVWAFAHVVGGAIIGEDCNICDHTFIEGKVQIGNRVTLKCGVFLWNGISVEDDVFIGPAAVFTNDLRPRSKRYLPDLKTVLKEGCSIGANSTVLPNLTIGRWAMVGAGSVVTRSVPDFALVMGNPARWRAWICRCGEKLSPSSAALLECGCGRTYQQGDSGELREFAANGSQQNPTNHRPAELLHQTNGHLVTNGH